VFFFTTSAVAALLAAVPTGAGDWTRFGYDAARSNSGPAVTGISAANVAHLKLRRVRLPGTVDASPIYLRGLGFFVTTSYGKTVLVSTAGKIRWTFTPDGYSSLAGSRQITNSTPVADPGRAFVYSAAPNGKIYKLAAATGKVVWSVAITRLPQREKIGVALNFSRGLVLAATGGYYGRRTRVMSRQSTRVAAGSSTSGTRCAATGRACSIRRPARRATRRSGRAPASSSSRGRAGCSSRPGTGHTTGRRTSATA
jgi:outer membrane protein assembly factor BamB